MKTICLNMIVKDEKPVIRRCLASVKQLIDYWVIVDTGSTDGTQQIIREFMQDSPGELHEEAWISFEHNRNSALNHARHKADYILFIDADETLLLLGQVDKNSLDQEFYLTMKVGQQVHAQYVLLINNDLGWRWKDVLHEYITSSHPMKGDILKEAVIDCQFKDGHRSYDLEKALKDAQILEKEIESDTTNGRYVFYLAQSYGNARNFTKALENFKKRVFMGGEPDEVFWSLYCTATLQQTLKMNHQTIIDGYCQAYRFDPSRAEPLYQLACYFQSIGAPFLGYLAAKSGLELKKPKTSMKVHSWVYDYGLFSKYTELSSLISISERPIF